MEKSLNKKLKTLYLHQTLPVDKGDIPKVENSVKENKDILAIYN